MASKERWNGEQGKVEHRGGAASRMQDIGIGRDRAEQDQGNDGGGRKQIEPEQGAAERESADTEAGEHCADRVERIGALRPHILDEERRQDDAGKPDRDVDQENPVPGNIGRNEAAERGTDERPDERRQGDPDHGIDQLAPVDAAHENEARHGCHHCSAHTLDDARYHELIERIRERTADRAEHEYRDRPAKDGARAETIGGPAADRDDDRKRQQVGRDRKLERQWARADVGGDRRQRRGDHGRIHVLHEQGDRHDQRHDAFCHHGLALRHRCVRARRAGRRRGCGMVGKVGHWGTLQNRCGLGPAPIVPKWAPPHINLALGSGVWR